MLNTYAALPVLAGYEALVAHTVIWTISVNTTPILTDALLLALVTIFTFMSFYIACLSLRTLTFKRTHCVHTFATLTQAWYCFTLINICGHRDNAIYPLMQSSHSEETALYMDAVHESLRKNTVIYFNKNISWLTVMNERLTKCINALWLSMFYPISCSYRMLSLREGTTVWLELMEF